MAQSQRDRMLLACGAKAGSVEDYPFGDGVAVFKIAGKSGVGEPRGVEPHVYGRGARWGCWLHQRWYHLSRGRGKRGLRRGTRGGGGGGEGHSYEGVVGGGREARGRGSAREEGESGAHWRPLAALGG